MPPTTSTDITDVFREYARLYELRNAQGGRLDPPLEEEWKQVAFTMESIFSGLYHGRYEKTFDAAGRAVHRTDLRAMLPVDYLRVPTEADVLCETPGSFFSGKLQDISTGGAYVHSSVPLEPDSRVRLTFCTYRDRMPLELEGRVAWSNPKGMRKRSLPEGAGIEFTDCDASTRRRLQEFIYELVEDTLVRANLI